MKQNNGGDTRQNRVRPYGLTTDNSGNVKRNWWAFRAKLAPPYLISLGLNWTPTTAQVESSCPRNVVNPRRSCTRQTIGSLPVCPLTDSSALVSCGSVQTVVRRSSPGGSGLSSYSCPSMYFRFTFCQFVVSTSIAPP